MSWEDTTKRAEKRAKHGLSLTDKQREALERKQWQSPDARLARKREYERIEREKAREAAEKAEKAKAAA